MQTTAAAARKEDEFKGFPELQMLRDEMSRGFPKLLKKCQEEATKSGKHDAEFRREFESLCLNGLFTESAADFHARPDRARAAMGIIYNTLAPRIKRWFRKQLSLRGVARAAIKDNRIDRKREQLSAKLKEHRRLLQSQLADLEAFEKEKLTSDTPRLAEACRREIVIARRSILALESSLALTADTPAAKVDTEDDADDLCHDVFVAVLADASRGGRTKGRKLKSGKWKTPPQTIENVSRYIWSVVKFKTLKALHYKLHRDPEKISVSWSKGISKIGSNDLTRALKAYANANHFAWPIYGQVPAWINLPWYSGHDYTRTICVRYASREQPWITLPFAPTAGYERRLSLCGDTSVEWEVYSALRRGSGGSINREAAGDDQEARFWSDLEERISAFRSDEVTYRDAQYTCLDARERFSAMPQIAQDVFLAAVDCTGNSHSAAGLPVNQLEAASRLGISSDQFERIYALAKSHMAGQEVSWPNTWTKIPTVDLAEPEVVYQGSFLKPCTCRPLWYQRLAGSIQSMPCTCNPYDFGRLDWPHCLCGQPIKYAGMAVVNVGELQQLLLEGAISQSKFSTAVRDHGQCEDCYCTSMRPKAKTAFKRAASAAETSFNASAIGCTSAGCMAFPAISGSIQTSAAPESFAAFSQASRSPGPSAVAHKLPPALAPVLAPRRQRGCAGRPNAKETAADSN